MPENAHNPEHAERNRPRREKEGQEIRQEGKQIYQAGERRHIFRCRMGNRKVRAQEFGGPQPQGVIDSKKNDRRQLDQGKQPAVKLIESVEGLQNIGGKVNDEASALAKS